jgi:alkylation response protein AidB-like acyl-CoA dehydrogenase
VRKAYLIEGEKQWIGNVFDADVGLVWVRSDEATEEPSSWRRPRLSQGPPFMAEVRVRRGRTRVSTSRSFLRYGVSGSNLGRAGRQSSLDYGG